VLLGRTLKSSTFRLALVCIAVFSGTVFALLGYVYWATTDFVRTRSDREISADRAVLVQTYEKAGRDGLADLVTRRVAGRELEAGVYVLADPARGVLAGNLRSWPPGLRGPQGWADVEVPDGAGHIRLGRPTRPCRTALGFSWVGASTSSIDSWGSSRRPSCTGES